jgi:hypothetical protein
VRDLLDGSCGGRHAGHARRATRELVRGCRRRSVPSVRLPGR